MVVALTQSGKAGTMSALIKNCLNHPSNLIPIENIYIITGLLVVMMYKQKSYDSFKNEYFTVVTVAQFVNDIKIK